MDHFIEKCRKCKAALRELHEEACGEGREGPRSEAVRGIGGGQLRPDWKERVSLMVRSMLIGAALGVFFTLFVEAVRRGP